MRARAKTVRAALFVVISVNGGVLACGSSDTGAPVAAGGTGAAGASVVAGGAGVAGAMSAGSAGTVAGAGGVSAAGASSGGAGSGGAAAGAAGSSAGSGGASAGAAGSSAGSSGMAGAGGALPFALTSSSFMAKEGCAKATPAACDQFPKDMWLSSYMQGGNHSPELKWAPGPAGTLSYALVLFDQSNGFTHWAVWDIPSSTLELPASLPPGAGAGGITGLKQASFFSTKDLYAGPGAAGHVYQFKLYALKVASINTADTGTDAQTKARTLLEASQDVLAKAELLGATP